MTARNGFVAALALWAGLGATGVHAAQAAKPCLTPAEATELIAFLAPEFIKGVGTACANTLPATALLRQTSGPFLAKYQAEATAAWPIAKGAMAKVAETGPIDIDDVGPTMSSMVSEMISEMITKEIKTKDCVVVDRILSLLAPLPPRNTAELFVTIAQLRGPEEQDGEFSICPAAL